MPLFHVHGLLAGLLAPLLARAEVLLPAGEGRFSASTFWRDLVEGGANVTWFTAVPTIHQILLLRAASGDGGDAERRHMVAAVARLRFVRSCSASLAPAVLADLERLAACVCCEAYAMTEVCHGHGAARGFRPALGRGRSTRLTQFCASLAGMPPDDQQPTRAA